MATIRKEITTSASAEAAWDALRDVGALHTRLVPGFVIDTTLEPPAYPGGPPEARMVTFGNGRVLREVIVSIDEARHRVVWTIVGTALTHHNGVAQVLTDATGGTRVVWTADVLPDAAAPQMDAGMEQGMAVMKATLDRLVS